MNLRNIFVPAGVIGLVLVGYASAGWPGVAAVVGGLVMWALLHFTRLMNVMKKAANRPMGYVGSAVMLNARLKPGVNLMHVVAMTQSLGERLSAGRGPARGLPLDRRHRIACDLRISRTAACRSGRWSARRPRLTPAE